jgi:hypothetical protein
LNKTIAVNDIGAVSYFGNIKVVDLMGIGSNEVARSIIQNFSTAGFLDSLTKRKSVKLAIIYESWFGRSLLDRWIKVGTWEIPGNIVCASSTVTFYVMNGADKNMVADDMRDYKKSLPADIKVLYY